MDSLTEVFAYRGYTLGSTPQGLMLTLIGFADDVDDLGWLKADLISLLSHILLHTLHLWTV